ncbi:MAG: DMT family transporter [Acidobacteriia bacterium]|nr:DMT family transporter [Terriglobia bacterium]
MKSYYFPLLLTIGGSILYHVAQKSLPRTTNPLVTMMLAYAVGILLFAVTMVFYHDQRPFLNSVRESNWAVFVVALGAASIEIGFLLAYRVGWNISIAPVASSVAVALLLIPIGILGFKEHLSIGNVVGIMFCVVGLILVTHK